MPTKILAAIRQLKTVLPANICTFTRRYSYLKAVLGTIRVNASSHHLIKFDTLRGVGEFLKCLVVLGRDNSGHSLRGGPLFGIPS